MVIVLLLFGVALYTAFENREGIYATLRGRDNGLAAEYKFTVSGQSKAAVEHFVGSYTEIISMSIWAAEPQINTRLLITFTSKDPAIASSLEGIRAKYATGIRLFNNEEKNDTQIVRLMNGEWMCAKTEDTIYATFSPEIVQRAPIICRTGLPPYYGEFSGFIELAMFTATSPETLEQIKQDAVKIADSIFTKDLMPAASKRKLR
jgi:hypothetical protein